MQFKRLGFCVMLVMFIFMGRGASAHPEPQKRHPNLSFAASRIKILPSLQLSMPSAPATPIIFLHPPKTGGTNVVLVAEAFSKTSDSVAPIRFPVPRVQGQSPNLIYTGFKGGLLSARQQLRENPQLSQQYTFFSAHAPFGLAHILNHKTAQYATLIRHPVEREISSVNFDFQRGYVSKENAEQYILERTIDNPQTRMIAGEEYMTGPCDDKTFARAIQNIETHFLLVGITEDVEGFIQALSASQNWGPVAIAPAQVTKLKVFETPPDSLRRKLLKKHAYDLKLYTWVKKRWAQWKATHIKHEKPISPAEKILTLRPSYAQTRTPEWMTVAEIEAYNQPYAAGDLTQLHQNHSGLKER